MLGPSSSTERGYPTEPHALCGPPAGWLVQTGFPPSRVTNLSCICFTSSRTVPVRDLEVLPSLLLRREKARMEPAPRLVFCKQQRSHRNPEITPKQDDFRKTTLSFPAVSIKARSSPSLQHACSDLSLLPAAARRSARSHQYHPRRLGYF